MVEFQELLSELGVPHMTEGHHHCREGWVQMDCPFCGPGSRKFHLGYNLEGGNMNCWKCGPHRVAETLAEATGQTLNDVFPKLKHLRRGHSHVIRRSVQRRKLGKPTGIDRMKNAHRTYLRQRRFDPVELERLWGVQGIGWRNTTLAWRLYIPIHFRGVEVSWTTRALNESSLRYRSASPDQEAIPHKELLYGMDYCRHACIVVEGPTDVWRIGPGAVCTFGTQVTTAQLEKLSYFPKRIICFDAEREAQTRANALASDLSVFPGETYVVTLLSGDPDQSPKQEIEQLRGLLQ